MIISEHSNKENSLYRSQQLQQQQNRLNSSNKIVNKPNTMVVSNNRRLSSGLFDTNININTMSNTHNVNKPISRGVVSRK